MRRIFSLACVAALLLALAGCGGASHTLEIIGDCEGYTISAGVPLEQAIALSRPRAEEFDLLLMGGDGLIARIPGDDLAGCRLIYSKEYAWELHSKNHPPSANIKNLANIAVVSASEDLRAVRFVSGGGAQALTAGQLLLRDHLRVLQEEGVSHLNGRSVTVYTTHWRVPLADILPEGDSFCAMGFSGEAMFFRGPEGCYLESGKNVVGLLLPDGRILNDLAGVMAGPPGFLITEAYADALHFLEQGERVMILELDGLGWEMLQRADAPYLKALQPRQALACYPPNSPAGLAAMLTGATPDANGIHGRENRVPACGDLFAKTEGLGKTCAYVEGNHTLIRTSLAPMLSLSDAETFANALQALAQNPDLLFVHFHGIDDAAHEYGPHAEQTLQKIQETDRYAQTLCEGFGGRVVITADHGLHGTEEGGNHGEFLPEDMLVPYVIK